MNPTSDWRFEHSLTLTERDWARIWQTPAHRRPKKRPLVRVALYGAAIIAGVVCVFWSYTLLLGIAILSLLVLVAFVPRLLKVGTRAMCEIQKHMVEPATHGVDSEGIWLRTPSLESRARWPLLLSWQIRGDWLILSTSGMPLVLLPISSMKQAGTLETVLEHVRTHGTEYK